MHELFVYRSCTHDLCIQMHELCTHKLCTEMHVLCTWELCRQMHKLHTLKLCTQVMCTSSCMCRAQMHKLCTCELCTQMHELCVHDLCRGAHVHAQMLHTQFAHAQVAHEVAHTQPRACCTGVAHTICTRTKLHTHNSHTQCCTHTQFAHKHTRFTPPAPSSRTLPAAVPHHRPHRNPPDPPNPCPPAPGSPAGGRTGSGAGPGAGTGGGAGRIGAERGRIGAAPLRQRGREPGGHGRAEQVRGHRAGGTGGGRGGLAAAPGLGWGSWGAPGGAQAWCCPGRASGGPPRAPRCLSGCREAGQGGALWAALGNIGLFVFLFCFFPLGIWVSGDVCPWEQLEKDQFQPPPRRGAFVNAVLSGSWAVPTLAAGVQSSQSGRLRERGSGTRGDQTTAGSGG